MKDLDCETSKDYIISNQFIDAQVNHCYAPLEVTVEK